MPCFHRRSTCTQRSRLSAASLCRLSGADCLVQIVWCRLLKKEIACFLSGASPPTYSPPPADALALSEALAADALSEALAADALSEALAADALSEALAADALSEALAADALSEALAADALTEALALDTLALADALAMADALDCC